MKLRQVINENKDDSKVLEFLEGLKFGTLKKNELIGAGFNLKKIESNTIEKISQTLGTYLDVRITSSDLKSKMKKVGIKNFEDVLGEKDA